MKRTLTNLHMQKAHLLRVLALVMAACAVVAAATSGAAYAWSGSPVRSVEVKSQLFSSSTCGNDFCFANTQHGNAPLFHHNGTFDRVLPPGTTVEVTCWYPGSDRGWGSDGIEDHVVWESISQPISGHVPDYYVNFGGRFPWQVGIDRCGTPT